MKTRLILSMLALLFATGILVTSLLSAPQVSSTTGTGVTERKVYFNQEILPDHVFYPALMVMDRINLETASTYERIYKEIQYGFDRLDSAKKLIDKEEPELAAVTLTKSLKYFQNAALEAQEHDAPDTVKAHLVKSMEFHNKEVKELIPFLKESDRGVIEKLVEENRMIAGSLK